MAYRSMTSTTLVAVLFIVGLVVGVGIGYLAAPSISTLVQQPSDTQSSQSSEEDTYYLKIGHFTTLHDVTFSYAGRNNEYGGWTIKINVVTEYGLALLSYEFDKNVLDKTWNEKTISDNINDIEIKIKSHTDDWLAFKDITPGSW